MELFDNLSSVGLTARVLQFIIVGGIVIFLLGMYWRFIVVGAGILFCVIVFAMPTSKPAVEVEKVEKTFVLPEVRPEVQQVEPSPPVTEVRPEAKEQADERMFLEDCNLHSGYTPSQCKALWESNKAEIEKSSWRYKHNKMYMKKV